MRTTPRGTSWINLLHKRHGSIYYIKDMNLFTMGWLRLVGSFKCHVSFAKEPDKRDYILQKRHVILRSLLIVATPYYIEGMYLFTAQDDNSTDCWDVYVYQRTGHVFATLLVERYGFLCRCVWRDGVDSVVQISRYGVATISRLLKMIGLFCRI